MKYKKLNLELGNRIRNARLSAGLTQAQLHDLTGISITQLSNYENGSRNIGIENLSEIAKATNKTIDEIYNGSQAERPLAISKNKGELIVNCVAALVDEGVISSLPRQNPNEFVGMGAEYYYQIGFADYVYFLDDMVKKLVDFNLNRNNYPDPANFKKQILAATAKQINSCK